MIVQPKNEGFIPVDDHTHAATCGSRSCDDGAFMWVFDGLCVVWCSAVPPGGLSLRGCGEVFDTGSHFMERSGMPENIRNPHFFFSEGTKEAMGNTPGEL